MRINGTTAAATAAAAAGTKRSASGSFSLGAGETQRTATTPALRSVGGIDALMALQGVETATERRKRAVGKGRTALDVLDTLKLGLLDGMLEPSTLTRLKSASAGLEQESGDPGLDAVLGEINLRVEVELAKAGVR